MGPAVMDQGLWLHPITTGCFGQALPLPQGRADTQGPMPKEPGGAGRAGGTAQESREQGPAWRVGLLSHSGPWVVLRSGNQV